LKLRVTKSQSSYYEGVPSKKFRIVDEFIPLGKGSRRAEIEVCGSNRGLKSR